MEKSQFWLVVWNKENGDFKNAQMTQEEPITTNEAQNEFETTHPDYRVIHIGEGSLPPKTYQALEYVE